MSFDDFDDFVTSSRKRTPSPPPVPAKPVNVLGARMASSMSGSFIHQRTQSLLEHAASQRGQWPSPAHARPTLSPPPPAFPSFSSDMDLLGDGDAVLATQSFGSPLSQGPSVLSPSSPPAPLMSQQPLLFAPLSQLSSRAPRAPAGSGQTGGLTAQDLSFFEGL
jgi:hypothetical protein